MIPPQYYPYVDLYSIRLRSLVSNFFILYSAILRFHGKNQVYRQMSLLHQNMKVKWTPVKLQNLSWCKTGFVSIQVLHLPSRLQNWICPKTGQYKTCIVSNSKIEASIRATKPKTWQSHLNSETVEIFIQNEKASLVSMQSWFWCSRYRVGAMPALVRQV